MKINFTFFYVLSLLILFKFINSFFSIINPSSFQNELFVLFLQCIVMSLLVSVFWSHFLYWNRKLYWWFDLIDDILLHIWDMLCTVNIITLISRDSFLRRKVARKFGIFMAYKRRDIREYRSKNKHIIKDIFISIFFFFFILIIFSVFLGLFFC